MIEIEQRQRGEAVLTQFGKAVFDRSPIEQTCQRIALSQSRHLTGAQAMAVAFAAQLDEPVRNRDRADQHFEADRDALGDEQLHRFALTAQRTGHDLPDAGRDQRQP